MAQFEPLIWERRTRRIRRPRLPAAGVPPIDPLVEFAGRPLGRLGRHLLSEVDLYLAFFALAQQPDSSGDS